MRGEPFESAHAGCGGYAGSGLGHCNRAATWVGVAYFPHDRKLCVGFACDEHRDLLDVARPLDDRGRAELERRRERDRLVIVEKQRYTPDPPLVTGREARERLARARAWAAQHDGWWVAPQA